MGLRLNFFIKTSYTKFLLALNDTYRQPVDKNYPPIWLYRPINLSSRIGIAYAFHLPVDQIISSNIKTDRVVSPSVKLVLFTWVCL